MLLIKSIVKGEGIASKTWTVGERYSRIVEEFKLIECGGGSTYEMLVYRVYDKKDNMLHEIEPAASLVINYMER
jgi:hypothetical protein